MIDDYMIMYDINTNSKILTNITIDSIGGGRGRGRVSGCHEALHHYYK